MATIGLFPHPNRPDAVALALATAAWLRTEGHQAAVVTGDVIDDGNDGDSSADDSNHQSTDDQRTTDLMDRNRGEQIDRWQQRLAKDLDLAVSLGGDGTMLRVVGLAGPFGVPVLGVNVGHLGFLAEVGPAELPQALKQFLAGEYRIEPRMTLAVEVRPGSGGDVRATTALNDAVMQRTSSGHTVRVAVWLSGTPFLTYAADSLIVATPTGSTAYNLSARGPIASPRTRVLVMTPVAAHMLFDRSLVLAEDEDVTCEIVGELPVELVVDGKSLGCLTTGDVVHCRAGDYDAQFVDLGGRDFHRVVKQKFGPTNH